MPNLLHVKFKRLFFWQVIKYPRIIGNNRYICFFQSISNNWSNFSANALEDKTFGIVDQL